MVTPKSEAGYKRLIERVLAYLLSCFWARMTNLFTIGWQLKALLFKRLEGSLFLNAAWCIGGFSSKRDSILLRSSGRRGTSKTAESLKATRGSPDCRKVKGDGASEKADGASRKGSSRKGLDTNPIITACAIGQNLRPVNKESLIQKIAAYENLLCAYNTLKSSPGMITPGVGKETLDGIREKRLREIQALLLQGKYKFRPGRAVEIPKSGGGTRVLFVGRPVDKLVQIAILQVLGPIFDPFFSKHSHGFRPNKGVKTALYILKAVRKQHRWILEADIEKCFDHLSHSFIMSRLRIKVSCPKTLVLVKRLISVGVVEHGVHYRSFRGIPQGAVLSPFLCNVCLDVLDTLIEGLIKKYTKGASRPRSNSYRKDLYLRDNLLVQLKAVQVPSGAGVGEREIQGKLWSVEKQLHRYKLTGDPITSKFIRINYVRYADDFVVTIIGPRRLIVLIKEAIAACLIQIGLNFKASKTRIFRGSNYFTFLGADIRLREAKSAMKKIVVFRSGKCEGKSCKVVQDASFHAPLEAIRLKFLEAGIIKRNPNMFANKSKGRYLP